MQQVFLVRWRYALFTWGSQTRGALTGATGSGFDTSVQVFALAMALAVNTIASAHSTSLQRFRVYSCSEVARGILLLLMVGSVVILQAKAIGLAFAYAFATILPSAVLLLYLDRTTTSLASPEPLRQVLGKFVQYGWPMTVWAALQASQALIERNVLSAELAARDFGRFMAVTDLVVRGIGLALMPIVTFLHARLMFAAGRKGELDAPARQLIANGKALVILAGGILTLTVFLVRPLLIHITPGIVDIDGSTLFLLCASAILWAFALIAHKPLELAYQTTRMGLLLGLVVLLQWLLLRSLVANWGEKAMPAASCAAAVVYILGCMLLGRRYISK